MLSEYRPIQILPSSVADQIAAGEVVERPANALKELLENACDAGSTAVDVEILGGGLERIRVSDDGHGIPAGELRLALSRYATSKIRLAEDLLDIGTYGFRGEALAAISAVSRVTLESRTEEQAVARRLVCEASRFLEEVDSVRTRGTTVMVESLFLNTPARKNFLKTGPTETNQCKLVVLRAALVRPDITFTLQIEEREAMVFRATTSLEERVQDIFNRGLGIAVRREELLGFERERGGYRVQGFLLPARLNIKNARGIHTFVNGRPVKDRVMQQALIAGVREVLFGGEYPQAVLLLDVDPGELDVNVHPTKAEVRFRDPGPFGLIRKAISEALLKLEPLPSSSAVRDDDESVQSMASSETTTWVPRSTFQSASSHSASGTWSPTAPMTSPSSAENPRDRSIVAGGFGPLFHSEMEQSPREAGISTAPEAPSNNLSSFLDFLGVAKSTYLICQDAEGLLLVDQHAAHERIRYEKLKVARAEEIGRSEALLIPLTIKLERHEVDLLLGIQTELASLGLELDRFGEEHVILQSLPVMLLDGSGKPRVAIQKVVEELAQDLANEESAEDLIDLFRRRLLHTLATESCHSSVRAGQRLGETEARALLSEMRATDYAGNCPHGRPTTVRLTWTDLERLFKRKL